MSNAITTPFLLLVAAVLVLLAWVVVLNNKINKLLLGGLSKDLPESLKGLNDRLSAQEKFKAEVSNYLSTAEKRILRSTQSVGLVRFNPFGEGQGGQSFAAAFIDEKGNGLVISSIYARERMSVFAKPLSKFSSSFELTNEENEAIKKAKDSLNA